MFLKPPKFKQNHLPKDKKTKNTCEENENKENAIPKHITVNLSGREFGKDVTNISNRNLEIVGEILKRQSFTKEAIKGNIYFKKNPSATQINNNKKEPLTTSENIANYYKSRSIKNLTKTNSGCIYQKVIDNIIPQKSSTTRNTVTPSYNTINSEIIYKRNVPAIPCFGFALSQAKDMLTINQTKRDTHFGSEDKEKPFFDPEETPRESIVYPITIIQEKLIKQISPFKEIKDIKEIIFFEKLPLGNPQIPIEYINTIYQNLLIEEGSLTKSQKAMFDYIKYQKEINEQMRSILTDWIIDVHLKFRFTEETLYMTINLIDRYLSIKNITKAKLQLLGITALMIACKHEEIDLPKSRDFIYITDNAYSREEVFQMENEVLSKLQFNLLIPSPLKFYEILSIGFNFTNKQVLLGKYLMETFLIDVKMIKYKASIIACACIYIVMKFSKMSNYQTSYDRKYYCLNESDNVQYSVKECAKDICLFVDNIRKTNYSSTQKKYSRPEYEKVALLIQGK